MSIHSLLFQWLFLKGQFGKLALTYHIQIINSKNPKNKQKSASFGMTFMIRAHLGIQEHFHQDLEEPRSSLLNSQDAWATTHFFILLRISVLVLQTSEQLFLWFFPPGRHLALICNFVKLKHKKKPVRAQNLASKIKLNQVTSQECSMLCFSLLKLPKIFIVPSTKLDWSSHFQPQIIKRQYYQKHSHSSRFKFYKIFNYWEVFWQK